MRRAPSRARRAGSKRAAPRKTAEPTPRGGAPRPRSAPVEPPAPPLNRIPGMQPIVRALNRTRREIRTAVAGEGIGWLVTAAVAGLGCIMLADWAAEFPRLTRAALLAALIALLLRTAWARFLQPLLRPHDDDTVALRIEKARPELRTRLISSVQLGRAAARDGSPEGLVAALVRDTAAMFHGRNGTRVVDREPAARALRIAGMLSVGAVLAALMTFETSTALFKRAFLAEIPVPRRTRIVELTGDTLAARGDDLAVFARVEGAIPRKGRIVLRLGATRRQELPLEPDPATPGRFQRIVARVQDPFTYTLKIGDASAGPFTVTTLPRPSVESVTFEQEFPAYTRLPRVRRLPGDLHLLAGSRLHISATASTALQSAGALLAGLETDTPLAVDAADPTRIQGSVVIPPQGLTGIALRLTDLRGLTSKGGAFHPVEIIPDRPPDVRLTHPARREELVTPTGSALLAFEAADDFGIAKAALLHKRAATGDKPIAVEFDLAPGIERELRRRFDWNIGKLEPPPAEGEIIEFWIRVEDANTATGPGVAESEHHTLRVVSPTEKRAELLGRMGDTLGGLQDIASEQERVTENLGTMIFAKPQDKLPSGTPVPTAPR
jgi:hypothetical protein